MSKFSKNLVYLRHSKGFSSSQAAQIAGVELEHYEKLELGEAKPSLAIVNRIAAFYGVDSTDLMYEALNVDSQTNVNNNISKKADAPNDKAAEKRGFVLSKGWNIAMLVVSAIIFVMYFLMPFFHSSEAWVTSGWSFDATFNITFLTLFSAEGWYMFDAILIILLNMWMLVSSIVLLCSQKLRSSTFAKVCSVINVVISSFYIFNMILLCVKINYTAHVAAWFVVYVIGLFASVFALIQKKDEGATKTDYSKLAKITKFVSIGISAIYSIYLLAAPICNDFSQRFRLFEYTKSQHGYSTITIILLTLCILFVTINSLIMLSKKALNGKYCFVGNIIAMIFSLITVVYIAAFRGNLGISPFYWATIPLCVLVIAAAILEIMFVKKAKEQNQI